MERLPRVFGLPTRRAGHPLAWFGSPRRPHERAVPLCGYAREFPALRDPGARTFEATPDTVWRAPDAVRWLRRWLPDTRLLALVRDPVERAFSHWRFARTLVAGARKMPPRCGARRAKLLALLDRDPYFAFEAMVDRAVGRLRLDACGVAVGVTPTAKQRTCAKAAKAWKVFEAMAKDYAVLRRVAAAAKAHGRPALHALWDAPFLAPFDGFLPDTCVELARAGGGDPLRCYAFACSGGILTDGIVLVGQYSNGLRPWFSAFLREHIHVVRAEDLESHTRDTVDGVVSFLGLPPAAFGQDAFRKRCPTQGGVYLSDADKVRGAPAANTADCTPSDAVKRVGADGVARYEQIPEHTRQLLAAHYAPFNRKLEALVDDGRPFWPEAHG